MTALATRETSAPILALTHTSEVFVSVYAHLATLARIVAMAPAMSTSEHLMIEAALRDLHTQLDAELTVQTIANFQRYIASHRRSTGKWTMERT